MTPNKALSIRQPWAHLIVAGIKQIENRTWTTRYRGPLLIHAGQLWHDETIADIERRHRIAIRAISSWVGSSASSIWSTW
jgi:hypothetical protein